MEHTFDESWRRRALGGDAEAVAKLAEHALRPLYAFCLYRVNGDRHTCEEVVQETLMRAIRDLERYEPERSRDRIFGWLAGLARNEIRRVRARDRKNVSLDALWQRMDAELMDVFAKLDSEPFADALLEREETRTMVNVTMSQLPPHYRETLEAKYLDGLSVREIAGAVGLTEKAVESQLVRARKAFRSAFTALARNLTIEPSF